MKNSYKTFNELNDSQKQEVATEFTRDCTIINQNTVVEYILNKSIEGCQDAPFAYDDISNNTPTGQIEINGCYIELDGGGRDDKLEFYERLRDKASELVDARYEQLNTSLNNAELNGCFDDEEAGALESKHDKAEELHNKYENICDELESMDFDDYPEIYQWFECDSYLIGLLSDKGECILDNVYWGRQCCGQSIILDCVIQNIAYEHYTGLYGGLPKCLNFMLSDVKGSE